MMANDSKIVITAGLQIPETVSTIKDDLSDVSKQLNSVQALKVTCYIDTKNIAGLQKQLSEVSKGLKLNIDSNTAGLFDDKAIKNQAKALSDALDLAIPRGKTQEVRAELQKLIDEYKKASEVGDLKGMTSSFNNLETYVNKFRKDVVEINQELVETQQYIKELARHGKVFISENDYSELKYHMDGGKNANALLSKAFGVGGWTKNIEKSTTTWDMLVQELNDQFDSSRANRLVDIDSGRFNDHIDGVIQLVDYLNQTFDQGDDLVKAYGEEIEKQFGDQLYSELTKVLGITTSLDDEWTEIFNPNEVKEVTQEVQELGAAIERSLSKYPDISIGADTKGTLEGAKSTLNTFFDTEGIDGEANRVKRAIEDTSGELQRFYVQVERGDKSVETLTYALNEQGTAYEYLGKTIREADNSTDFRRKDITTQWSIQTEKLQQFIANAEKAGAASGVLQEDITNLQNKLAAQGDTSAMNSFLDDFDIAKAKLQAFKAEATKNNAFQSLSNRIRKLAADVDAYAAANQRAVESTQKMSTGRTFADTWGDLSSMAKNANLTDQQVKQLSADMAVFKKEAKAAGLEGATAFQKFGNAFKLISTYISANQIINMITRTIRSAITELKEIDNTLTEISKTSERTAESLRKLGEASFDSASKYGRTANDYLLGVQEMSRAGFGERQSENLAELSLRAQAAGDMTAEMANQYIIATNAAYGYEGSLDKLNRVLDSQNYITNRNAVDMENLTAATKIAASQAAASGVAVDELTAAVGTMSAVTQQGGYQAGRAFKGILMNIQQVKGAADDIGDGGADITAESLSKYEQATAALGVSLKEVKNGVTQLREPMEVLRELSIAVRQESEGSIKVANLISAVGGKFRGNQLIALLENWDTYEKMLAEFNSNEAIGSAMEEAEKSANNWAGSLNKVKNSWSELVNQFINSDNAVDMLQSLNNIIQNLTESSATGSIKTIVDGLSSMLKIISKITDKIGTLPTLLSGIAIFNSFRGKGRPTPNMPIYAPLQLCA